MPHASICISSTKQNFLAHQWEGHQNGRIFMVRVLLAPCRNLSTPSKSDLIPWLEVWWNKIYGRCEKYFTMKIMSFIEGEKNKAPSCLRTMKKEMQGSWLCSNDPWQLTSMITNHIQAQSQNTLLVHVEPLRGSPCSYSRRNGSLGVLDFVCAANITLGKRPGYWPHQLIFTGIITQVHIFRFVLVGSDKVWVA